MNKKICLAATLLSFCFAAVAADHDAPELGTRFGHYHASYRVNDDATHVETHGWTTRILQTQALEGAKRISISYSTSIQKAEVLHAYTLKADGRRIDAPQSNYQIETNTGKDAHTPVFSDLTTLTVVFPEVAVGDTLAFAYRLTQSEAMFPGQFSISNTLSKLVAYDDVKVTMDLPAALWVQYAARQMREQRTEKAGRVVLEWTYQNPQPLKNKRRDWSVYDPEDDPGYAVSTFQSYAQIAEAYGARARGKAAVSDRIRKLAADIVGETKTPRDQAQALYDWVTTHITYAGNCIGVGAVVPHELGFVLDNQMGDCKDHATLLQALLAARNIDSTQALVSAGSIYRLPKIPVAANVNHVINYLPALNLFVDSTSQVTPFGMLPFGVSHKPVLLVDGFKEGLVTPPPPIGLNRQHMKSTVRFAADGSVKADIDVTLNGNFAADTRARVRQMPKDAEEEMLKNLFANMGQGGIGQLVKDNASALTDRYHYRVSFEAKDMLPLPGPAALFIYPMFPTEAPVQRFLSSAAQPDLTVDTACNSGHSVEEYTYYFPKKLRILSVPKNLSLENAFLAYQATYQRKGNILSVKRVLDDRTPGPVCSPAMALAYKKFMDQVAKNIQAQVIYQ